MEEPKKIIEEQFKKLPKALQDAIVDSNLYKKMRAISEKHKMLIDKASIFENETMFVMLGLENSTDYTNNLKKEMRIDDSEAQEIAKEVNEQIFLPIRESLKEMEDKNTEEARKEVRETGTVQEPESAEPETTTEPVEQTQTPANAPATQEKSAKKEETGEHKPSNIFENKLTEQVRSPKENVRMEEPSSKKGKAAPRSVDPYREPIDD